MEVVEVERRADVVLRVQLIVELAEGDVLVREARERRRAGTWQIGVRRRAIAAGITARCRAAGNFDAAGVADRVDFARAVVGEEVRTACP